MPLIVAPAIFAQGQDSESSSLLWKVSGNGLASPSYLFGTIHALPQSRFFLPDSVEKALASCEKVVLEIDMDEPGMMSELQQEMLMTDNALDRILSHDEYELIAKFFIDSLGIPLAPLANVKPMLLTSFMLPKIIGQNPASYEGIFVQMAGALGKEVLGLETVQEQIGYIDKVPLDKQAKMLVESIIDFNKSKAEYDAMLTAYETQNIEDIYRYMLETSNDFKEMEELLIKNRNHAWVPRIGKLAKESTCFFAVGSGHLGGSEGVVALLRQAGYSVIPVF
ncbi:TraB/GumN family protein [Williamwhitmania taraxaci]|uniref:TraB/GumN family protein n=1 Tax=Williamwhitmania taraxaci TaxID=1640674 RepID=UPI00147E9B69|nr:TraB/GumN family protein [Williamwhitmania taraxaci]